MTNVLIIGMLDSIHLTRWLSQFEDQSIKFTIYPSTKFKSVHPELSRLVKSNKNYRFTQKRFVKFFGYKEFFFNKFLAKISKHVLSENRLARLIRKSNFDYIHVLEIQGAGYLLSNSRFEKSNDSQKIIVTNWGSDIYYFEKNLEDKTRIQKILSIADYYSAECHRDYELALKNGFTGKFLPINPNAGGFKMETFKKNTLPVRDRNLIIAKCYGEKFGLGEITIDALLIFLKKNESYKVFLYSVTPDLVFKIENLVSSFPGRVSYSTVKNKLTLDEMYKKFAESIIYIGASKSDGISTSFLEALVLGAYPIQTNTSCGIEWTEKGFKAQVINPNIESLVAALEGIPPVSVLEQFRVLNKSLALEHLSYSAVKVDSLKFYGINK